MTVITIGTSMYDVYGTEAGLKSYLGGRLGADAYDNASGNDRKRAMVMAARWIDREKWQGTLTDSITPQPLAFPRTGITDCEGNAVGVSTIPDDVINASYELVLILLGDPTAASKSSQGGNIKSVGAGSAQVSFFRAGAADGSGSIGVGIFPVEAQKLLRCYLQSAASLSGPTITGTSQPSHFGDCDYRTQEGFA